MSKATARVDWRKVWVEFRRWFDEEVTFSGTPAWETQKRIIRRLVKKHTTVRQEDTMPDLTNSAVRFVQQDEETKR